MLAQYTLFLFATCFFQVWALEMDTSSADSIKSGLSQIAKGMILEILQGCLSPHTIGGSQGQHGAAYLTIGTLLKTQNIMGIFMIVSCGKQVQISIISLKTRQEQKGMMTKDTGVLH